MRWDKRGKNGRFISKYEHFNAKDFLPTEKSEVLMEITAPRGHMVLYMPSNPYEGDMVYSDTGKPVGGYGTACEAVRAFMEQHASD